MHVRRLHPRSAARSGLQRQHLVAPVAARSVVTLPVPPNVVHQHIISRPAHSAASKPKLLYCGPASSMGAGDGMSAEKGAWEERFDGNMIPPKLSKPDAHFHAMGVEFVEVRDGISLSELNDLFEKVGFPRRDPDKLRVALENTYRIVWVRSTKQTRVSRLGQLIGFARATSDGVLSATIWDVAVLPAWQRLGLGRAMVERLTYGLVGDGIPTIGLYAEPNVVVMYEKMGFIKDPEGIRGMAFQRRKKEREGAGASKAQSGLAGVFGR